MPFAKYSTTRLYIKTWEGHVIDYVLQFHLAKLQFNTLLQYNLLQWSPTYGDSLGRLVAVSQHIG